jgi:hypothetical protein
VIDPLVYSTYIGGSDGQGGLAIAVDGSGNAYVTGSTSSLDYDVTPGAFQTTNGGQSDVFVTKLNATGTALVYSTYIGGSWYDYGYAIAVDGSGNAYVTGSTYSTNYDVTPGAFQTTRGGGLDVFVTKVCCHPITITLTSAPGTNNQTVCVNTAITPITYSTTGATGATFSGLPAGVTGTFSGRNITISGTPTVAGTFNYTVTLIGGCGNVTATGTIIVRPNNTITLTSAPGTDNQTVCVNTPITPITYSTIGATGATFSDLPAGVTGTFSGDDITISGTPTVAGTFNYTVTLTGGCGGVTATGTIIVRPNNTITLTSAPGTDNQTVFVNTPITPITYSTTGATGATFAGLPAGVTGTFSGGNITISDTPIYAQTDGKIKYWTPFSINFNGGLATEPEFVNNQDLGFWGFVDYNGIEKQIYGGYQWGISMAYRPAKYFDLFLNILLARYKLLMGKEGHQLKGPSIWDASGGTYSISPPLPHDIYYISKVSLGQIGVRLIYPIEKSLEPYIGLGLNVGSYQIAFGNKNGSRAYSEILNGEKIGPNLIFGVNFNIFSQNKVLLKISPYFELVGLVGDTGTGMHDWIWKGWTYNSQLPIVPRYRFGIILGM